MSAAGPSRSTGRALGGGEDTSVPGVWAVFL